MYLFKGKIFRRFSHTKIEWIHTSALSDRSATKERRKLDNILKVVRDLIRLYGTFIKERDAENES